MRSTIGCVRNAPAERPGERLQLALRESARISGIVATYCDRIEHNEAAVADSLRSAARRLRDLAAFLAEEFEVDLMAAYAARLEQLERSSPLEPLLPRPASSVRQAKSLRELQLAQLRHDRHYHPDVFGLHKRDQLMHIALHLSKLVGSLAQLCDGGSGTAIDFTRRRLPDLLLFGIKLATVTGESLESEVSVKPSEVRAEQL